jgi:MacB-like periplasmic core domain
MIVSDEAAADPQHVRNRLLALMARLREEPGVTAVTFSSAVPGFGPDRRIEFPNTVQPRDGGMPEVTALQIDVDLLKVYGARIVAGRDFTPRDTSSSSAVIVNRTFASDVLGVAAQAALGSRFRYESGTEWFEIVGVVDDFPGFPRDPGSETEPNIYRPAAAGSFYPPVVSMRFSGPVPERIAERLRGVGAQVDPALQLRRAVPLSYFYNELRSLWRNMAWAVGIITLAVLLLSAAGMHALMAFTIAQRTREIGIRSALGAQPRQLLMGLFGRAMRQLSIGLAVGSFASVGVFAAAGIGARPAAAMLLVVATVMAVVASFAALGPARRSLRLSAVEALRVEG